MNEKLFLFQLQSLFGIVSKFISDHRKLSKDSKEIGRPLLSKGNLHFSLVEENQNDYDKKTKIVKQYVWFVGVFSNLYNFNCLRPGGMKTSTHKDCQDVRYANVFWCTRRVPVGVTMCIAVHNCSTTFTLLPSTRSRIRHSQPSLIFNTGIERLAYVEGATLSASCPFTDGKNCLRLTCQVCPWRVS